MTEQDKTSSQDHVAGAASGADAKRPAVPGSAVSSRPVEATEATKPQASPAKPAIDSTLVGKSDAAPAPATKKSTTGDKTGKPDAPAASVAKPAAAISPAGSPPVFPDAKPADLKTSETKPADAKPVSTPPSGSAARAASATAQPVPRRSGFFPTFLGGVVAAGLGAAACYWAIPHLPAGWQPSGPEVASPEAQLDAARQAAVDAARAEFQTQSDALGTRAAEAGADAARQLLSDNTPTASGAPAGLPPDLADKLAALEKTVAGLSGNAPAGAAAADADARAAVEALASRVEQQQARLDELAARPAVDPATAAQVQTLAQQAQELQQSTEAANRRASAASAATALMAAIENGTPRDQALAELKSAGVEVPAVLSGEVPRVSELRAEFPAAARAGLKAARDSASSEGTMTALGNFLRVQTGARSIEPREGNDPDAVLSRANAAVETGDISDALTEIGTLPQPAQQAMATWVGRAKTWTEANAALAALAAGGH